MQEWLTAKQIHELYPRIRMSLIQAAARKYLVPLKQARKMGDERRGMWLIAPAAIPGLLARVGKPGRKARRPTEDEKAVIDRIYRKYCSVASINKHFGIRWTRAKAWLVEVYGPNLNRWPGH